MQTQQCSEVGCHRVGIYRIRVAPSKWGKNAYCKDHRREGTKRFASASQECAHPGCDKLASFGSDGGRIEHCMQHRCVGHLNLRGRTCLTIGCTRQVTLPPILRGGVDTNLALVCEARNMSWFIHKYHIFTDAYTDAHTDAHKHARTNTQTQCTS